MNSEMNETMNGEEMNGEEMNSPNNSGSTNVTSGGRRRTRKNMRNMKKNMKTMNMMGGAKKIPAVGSKAEVWHGSAKHTSGGLTKSDLMKTKKGRIVSRKKHAAGKKALKNLVKAGYKAKKGTFKLFKK